jgi:anti-sigma B factor antagonist
MGRGEHTELIISTRFDGLNHTVVLEGELDMATAPRLEAALTGLAPHGEGLVLLDLENLSFSDALGLAAIERAARALRGRLIICGPRAPVRGIIELTRMDERVEVKDQGAAEVSDIAGANIAYVRRLWEAYEKGGGEGLVAITEDDVRWRPLGATSFFPTSELLDFWSSRPPPPVSLGDMNAVGHDVLVTWRLEDRDPGEMWSLHRFQERRLLEVVSFDSETEVIAALRLFDRRPGR